MKSLRFVSAAYARAVHGCNQLQSLVLLSVRLFWGWQFAVTGWGKLQHLDKVTDFFTSLGLPMPHETALFVGLVEFLGGILFALGIGSRLVSFALFVNMTVAYWTADRDALLGILSSPDKFYGADPFTFWFAALIILIFGPGYFGLDTILARWPGRQPRRDLASDAVPGLDERLSSGSRP